MAPRTAATAVAALAVIVTAGACSSSSSRNTSATSVNPSVTAAAPAGGGPVDVLYAGSLVNLMEKQIGPAFHTATGYTLQGFAAGSDALANQIKGGVRQGDVFVSASPTVDAGLTGAANGDWMSWYATFAKAPLVLGYNAGSRFAADITSKPWYAVITEPGFLLGRTDPATDPKGKLTAQALTQAETTAPGLAAVASSTSNVFPEETLVGRLQAGQLDAGFFYSSEAKAANIPTVPLAGSDLHASYTVTILNRAPHASAAQAFVAFLLGRAGRSFLQADGFGLVQPASVTGSGVPAALSPVVGG